jgi:hypothetical protein
MTYNSPIAVFQSNTYAAEVFADGAGRFSVLVHERLTKHLLDESRPLRPTQHFSSREEAIGYAQKAIYAKA